MAVRSGEGLRRLIQPSQLLWKFSDAARQFRERRTLTPEEAMGKRGEDLAHRYLQGSGFSVLARNYRPSGGASEVDIVARDGSTVVFVEVKSRATGAYGSPDRAIDEEKQKRITAAARNFAIRAGIEWSNVRFDTISIVFSAPPSIVHQQDAFFHGRAR